MGEPRLVEISTQENFDDIIKDSKLSVIHFYADWAVECQPMSDVLRALSLENDLRDVNFGKIAAETFPKLSMSLQISAVPTFLLFLGGKVIDRLDGANAVKLTQIVKANSAKARVLDAASLPAVSSDAKPVNTTQTKSKSETLNDKLKRLINQAPVVLFMKGSADAPQCGFSRQAVGLLKEFQAQFATFDIFSDEEVRQGLKVFSNWPTYPQLYINGELVGGLDIMKEMAETGDLSDMLKKAVPSNKSLNDKLKLLVNQSPLMIFMKGDPQTPRCGFSRQLVEILNDTKLPYGTFDILSDEEVRQGLKTFSNWPTYPQVYVKGELIGGLDIIKELKENGELLTTLKGQ